MDGAAAQRAPRGVGFAAATRYARERARRRTVAGVVFRRELDLKALSVVGGVLRDELFVLIARQ